MAIYLKEDVSTTIRIGPFLDQTDGFTAETALAPTVQLSKNGGAFAARSDATALAHDADGWYSCVLNTTDTNTAGTLQLKSVVAGALPVWHELTVLPALVYDSLIAGTDQLQVDAVQWVGVAPNALLTGRVDSSVGAMAAGTVTAAAVATGAIDADAIATDAIAEIADGVLDEALSGHTTVGTLGQRVQPFRSGTAQAGAASSITLDAGASATSGFYVSALVVITGGTGAGQSRRIQAYNGTSKVATVAPGWLVVPDVTSQFMVLPDASSWEDSTAEHFAPGSFGNGVKLISGAITSGTFGTGAITAAAIAADAIGASELAADAVAEIADGVWDEPIAGHLGAGSTGEKLNAAGAAGDPWTTALPGAYGAGSAGNIVGNRLDTTVGSRLATAGYTAPDNAGVAAIKAKTDALPASPAAVGSAMTLDLIQAVPTTNTAQSVGDALNAARAQGFGKWELVGTALKLFAPDGSTIVRTFTLDDPTAPTSRT